MKGFLTFVCVVGLLALGAFVYLDSQQLGITIPSLEELEHRADVAAGQLGDKSVPMWHDFLARSWKFAEQNPDNLEIWLLRGAGALAAEDRDAGKEAGEHLVILNKSADPTTAKLIKVLWAKRWLPTSALDSQDARAIFNELAEYSECDCAIQTASSYEISFYTRGARNYGDDKYETVEVRFRPKNTMKIEAEDHYCHLTGEIKLSQQYRGGDQVDYDTANEFRFVFDDRKEAQLASELLQHLNDSYAASK